MTNANIKIAQNAATLKTAGTLMGLWCLCVFCCFSSSAASIVSLIRGLQSVPGKVVESTSDIKEKVGEALKSDKIASIKLYKECEDTEFTTGFEIKLNALSEGDGGEIITENGVHIKNITGENVSFDMTYIRVYEDGHEETKKLDIGFTTDIIFCLCDECREGPPHEVHGKVMYAKDIKIKWKPYLAAVEPQVEGYSIKK
tara:strand:- start:598 stop:1197 length:600 start_codon:yes stop_codon:yes gene_type:complete